MLGSSSIPSLGRVLLGVCFVVVALKLTVWNEKLAILSDKAKFRPEQQIVNLNPKMMDPTYEGRMVYVVGEITTDETLQDPLLLVSQKGLILDRNVEMYQWAEVVSQKEEHHWFTANKSYEQVDYQQQWTDKPINSSEFQFSAGQTYENPTVFPIPDLTFTAANATLGAFTVDPTLLKRMKDLQPLDLRTVNIEQLQQHLASPMHIQHDNFQLFLGDNIEVPAIGNLRVSMLFAKPGVYSILGMQQGNKLVPYKDQAGRDIGVIKPGKVALAQMIDRESVRSVWVNVLSRILILILWLVGVVLFLQGVSAFSDKWPWLSRLHSNKAVLVGGVFGFWLDAFVTNLQWFSYRPGFALIGFLGLSIIAYVIYRFR